MENALTLELHSTTEVYALKRAIDARKEELLETCSYARGEVSEYLALCQIAFRLPKVDVLVEEKAKND